MLRENGHQWKARFLGDENTTGMSGVLQPDSVLEPVHQELRRRSIPRLLLRWPILQKSVPNGALTSRDAVITAIFLHNFCIGDQYFKDASCKMTARGKSVIVDPSHPRPIPHHVNVPVRADPPR
jgi:hypothetical protein